MISEKYKRKLDSREAWIRRLGVYWNSRSFPRFNAREGEIFEVDFGENVGTEFSGRHLALCLKPSLPSDEKMLVVPLTSKYQLYNILDEDIITCERDDGNIIKAGIVLKEARWISKIRIFRVSKIFNEDEGTLNPVKGYVKISSVQVKRWSQL